MDGTPLSGRGFGGFFLLCRVLSHLAPLTQVQIYVVTITNSCKTSNRNQLYRRFYMTFDEELICAVVTPVGPGHETIFDECTASRYADGGIVS